MKQLSKSRPTMPYICPPSAVKVLNNCGISDNFITTIVPDQVIKLRKGDDLIEITATTGALVGPPWQANENGNYSVNKYVCFYILFSFFNGYRIHSATIFQ